MKLYHLLLLGTMSTPLMAVEQWIPSDHPATIERRLVAFTRPAHELQLTSEVAAKVVQVHVDTGDRTAADDSWAAVITLDDTFAKLERDRIAAQQALAEAEAERLRAELAVSERELVYRQGEVDRIASLAAESRVPKRDLDEASFIRDRIALSRDSTKAALAGQLQQVRVVAQQLREADERITRHVLRAPPGWIVTERLVEPGAYVQPGQQLLNLADVGELAIDLYLAEEEIAALPADRLLGLHFPRQIQENKIDARLHRISPRFDPRSKKRLVELRLAGDRAPQASGGLTVEVVLTVVDPNGGWLVPQRFVTRRYEQYFLTLAGSDGKGISRPVTPRRSDRHGVIIARHDLAPGSVLQLPDVASGE